MPSSFRTKIAGCSALARKGQPRMHAIIGRRRWACSDGDPRRTSSRCCAAG